MNTLNLTNEQVSVLTTMIETCHKDFKNGLVGSMDMELSSLRQHRNTSAQDRLDIVTNFKSIIDDLTSVVELFLPDTIPEAPMAEMVEALRTDP